MNEPESNKETLNKNNYTTADIFEITAIGIITGGTVRPFRTVVTFGDVRNRDKAWAVYPDKTKIPKKSEIKQYMEFRDEYRRVKQQMFDAIRHERFEQSMGSEDKPDKKKL